MRFGNPAAKTKNVRKTVPLPDKTGRFAALIFANRRKSAFLRGGK